MWLLRSSIGGVAWLFHVMEDVSSYVASNPVVGEVYTIEFIPIWRESRNSRSPSDMAAEIPDLPKFPEPLSR